MTQGGGGVSYKSDPTANKVVQLVQMEYKQAECEQWVKVIERTICNYADTDKGKLLELRYFAEIAPDYICEKLHIERATFYNWAADIVTYTALQAVQAGLIRID